MQQAKGRKQMKKLLLVIVCLLLLSTLGWAQKKLTIGVDMVYFKSPYASGMVKEWKAYCEKKGINLIILDADLDIEKEAHNVDILVDKKCDGYIILPVDAEASKVMAKKLIATGKPVLNINSRLNNAKELGIRAWAGPDSYLQAQAIARAAIKLQPDARVVILTGTPGYAASIEREKGFTDTVAKEGPRMKILDIQTCNWSREEGQRVSSDFITKYGKEITMVYTCDDNVAVGAVNAFKAAGYTKENRPRFVSLTAMPEFMDLIKEGWGDLTCIQSPKVDVDVGMDALLDIIAGKQKEQFKEYNMENVVVDKSNIQKVIDMRIWD
jgi:ABC-type sugar transport system substrate-binding protein